MAVTTTTTTTASTGFQVTPGARVRITRRQPDGRVKFVKTGTVGDKITPDYFAFQDDDGRRVYVASDTGLPKGMTGWTQVTKPV